MRLPLLILVLTYLSSSTLFSLSANYTISLQQTHDELAHIHYDQKLNQHGMNYIHIYTNAIHPLLTQHRAAGYL
jgi:hypothetical protein